jgi:hypothetical protein
MEHADVVGAVLDDLAIAIRNIRNLGDKNLGHKRLSSAGTMPRCGICRNIGRIAMPGRDRSAAASRM